MALKIIIGFVILLVATVIVLTVLIAVKPEIFYKNRDSQGDLITADNTLTNGTTVEQIGDTKDFVPVRAFDDYAFSIGKYDYRAIIEVSSVNYNLMNEEEQNIVEVSYRRFLNSLNFPITLYKQTREFDNVTLLHNLEDSIKNSSSIFPQIKDYASEYYKNMSHLTEYINNSLIKKNFIIVPFDSGDLDDVSALTSEEIQDFILEELWNRSNIVKAGIEGVGLSATILDKREICECLYSYYHRDTYKIAHDFLGGGYNSLVVDSSKAKHDNRETVFKDIVIQAQNRVEAELNRANISKGEYLLYQYVYRSLEDFKGLYGTDLDNLFKLLGQENVADADEEMLDSAFTKSEIAKDEATNKEKEIQTEDVIDETSVFAKNNEMPDEEENLENSNVNEDLEDDQTFDFGDEEQDNGGE